MLKWTFIIFACLIIAGLNIVATRAIQNARLITKTRKGYLLILIWLVPVFGFILAMILFSNEMKKQKDNSDKNLITALNSFTDKMNAVNKEIKQKREDEGN
jgi:D-alanyl-lipoteichoic acid acyltransferase DltB (MBOAT superfamily)